MNSQLLLPYSFVARLLLLVGVLVPIQTSYASPQLQQNASTSFSKLQSEAEQGDAVAQYNLAISYLRNNSTSGSTNGPSNEDYQSALKWLGTSAAHGNADAEFLLGYLYEHGQGVHRDYAKAAESYRAAALRGHSSAENNLASLYQHGQGVPKNMDKAFEWYRASAQHGNQVGQCNLATVYYLG